ncbi:ectoine/hydroxyectoine ABC transporter substrate-binding protein EhuB [Numidum massiliense]|uniref:ectoine/hydroxyectoine ABC transporter substrate-binding protein EhuB n=1 Tax=Numidum massiliense TaxID=1522315 RepID=UPI0006D581C1|nr:ectoine/hydroxyectoine ABC transporter substrate-binding protein EhuB [Numidum massiliense]
MKKFISLSIVLLLSMWVVACGSEGDNNGKTLERIKSKGKVTIGFANEKPYGYKTSDGKITGEAVEVARAIFKEIGVEEMEGHVTEFGSLIPGLQAERFDVITAGMYIAPERCKEVAFAEPEVKYGEALAVKKGNPKNLHGYEDIAKNPDVKVSVMAGANQVGYLKKLGVKEEQIVIAPDIPANISAVESGRVDATTMTDLTLRSALQSEESSKVEIVDDFKQPIIDGKSVVNYGAAAFRKEDDELRKKYNEELKKLKESGKLLEIIEQFGFTEDNLPDDMTTKQLCSEK